MWFEGRGYSESFKDLINISWHGNIDMLKLVIPFQGESTLECAVEVACCCVFFLNGIVQVVHVSMIGVLDTEIIDNEGEC